MNIGSVTNAFVVSSADLRPAELSSPQKNALSEQGLSSRPVPAVAAIDPANPMNTATEGASGQAAQADSEKAKVSDQAENRQADQKLKQEQQEIRQLAARDREVRAHEQAHAAVGGQYAGAPSYQFQRGPDGVRYAVGGEVPIDVSKAATPQETVRKMQVVRRAALAPAEPSPQDRRVAAEASSIEAQARQELNAQVRAQQDAATSSAQEGTASQQATPNGEAEETLATNPTGIAQSADRPQALSTFRPALPPSAINGLLQRATLADDESRSPGALLSQFA